MSNKLKITSWNLRGMGDVFQGIALRKWINRFHWDLDGIGLQELKAKMDKIDFQLQTLFSTGKIVVDYSEDGKARAAVGSLSGLQINVQGTKGDNHFSWCTVETVVGPVNVGLVHAPNERAGRKDLWEWMVTQLPFGNWVLVGDWNMTKFFDDLAGPSARLHSNEECSWKRMIDKLDLIDH